MKSFLRFVLLVTAIITNFAFAQMSTRPSPKVVEADKSDFQKFHSRLRISLFSVLTMPTIYDIEKGNWRYGATSPETQTFGNNRDTLPTNFWNQVSFNYNFGAKMNFVFNPRFSFWPIRPEDPGQNPEASTFQVEDFLVGFQGVVYTNEDKKFNLWLRPGMRLPTSRASRNSGNGGFGTTTNNVELALLPTYDFNSTWQVGGFLQWRQWIFDDRYNYSRFRFYTAPYVQYTFNDTTRVQLYYENMVENFRRWETLGAKQKPLFKDLWQNAYVGLSHDVTPKLNLFPFVSAFVNDPKFSSKSFWIGAWISYQIK